MTRRGSSRARRRTVAAALVGAAVAAVGALPVEGAPDPIRVGPGPVAATLHNGAYTASVRIAPNHGGLVLSTFTVRLRQGGEATEAAVSARFRMPSMPMPQLSLRLSRRGPGLYVGVGRKLTMPGVWEIRLRAAPHGGAPVEFVLIDRVGV